MLKVNPPDNYLLTQELAASSNLSLRTVPLFIHYYSFPFIKPSLSPLSYTFKIQDILEGVLIHNRLFQDMQVLLRIQLIAGDGCTVHPS